MGATMARRRRRGSNKRTVVRIPEQPLHARVLDLAAPLIERLGATPPPEALRERIELSIAFWNAKAQASKAWGPARPKMLNDLTRKMTGKKASAEDVEAFALLSERWREKALVIDPRMVGEWSLEVGDDGSPRLSCAMELADGVEAEIPPPIETRVAIGGQFVDETMIRLTGVPRTPGTPGMTAMLSFPLRFHWGTVSDDGTVTVHTKMPTAVALLAEGVVPPVGGAAVELTVQGKKLDAMMLSEVCCDMNDGCNDVAVLVFKPASPSAAQ